MYLTLPSRLVMGSQDGWTTMDGKGPRKKTKASIYATRSIRVNTNLPANHISDLYLTAFPPKIIIWDCSQAIIIRRSCILQPGLTGVFRALCSQPPLHATPRGATNPTKPNTPRLRHEVIEAPHGHWPPPRGVDTRRPGTFDTCRTRRLEPKRAGGRTEGETPWGVGKA